MTAAASSPIGWTRDGRGAFPAADGRLLRALFFGVLLLLHGLFDPRKLIASALAAGLILAPMPGAFAHDRLQLAGQTDVPALDAADHGHSHDDGENENDLASQSHGGHDPADHSHQIAFLSGGAGHDLLPLLQGWPSHWKGMPDQASGLGIERPPKRMMSL